METVTPLRKQYLSIKEQYPKHVVLFELGDFFEAFDDDATTIATDLDLVLTTRPVSQKKRVAMAGFPKHALEDYLKRLVEKGRAVAVVEQIPGPAERGLAQRRVTRVLPEPAPITEERKWKTGDFVETPKDGIGKVVGYGSDDKVLVGVFGFMVTVGEGDLKAAKNPLETALEPSEATNGGGRDSQNAEITRLQAEIARLEGEIKQRSKMWSESEVRYDRLLLDYDQLQEENARLRAEAGPKETYQEKFVSERMGGSTTENTTVADLIARYRNEGWEVAYELIEPGREGVTARYYARLERKIALPLATGDDQTEQATSSQETRLVKAIGEPVSFIVPETSFSESVRSGNATPEQLKVIADREVARARIIPVMQTMENIVERGFTDVPGEETK